MGLGFHIPQKEGDGLGIYLGQLDMNELHFLQQNGFLVAGNTGHFPEDSEESLPYFDDVALTIEQVNNIKSRFDRRRETVMKTTGFKSEAVEKICVILSKAQAANRGLATCAD